MKIIARVYRAIKHEIELYRRFCRLSREEIEALRNGPWPTAPVRRPPETYFGSVARPATRSILINRPGGRVDVVGVTA